MAREIRYRREISPDEALLVAEDALDYLRCLVTQAPGGIEFPVIAGRETHLRRCRAEQPEKLVTLHVLEDEDADLLAEFGVSTMQVGRMSRVIEDAYYQDGLLDSPRLCLLFPLTHRAIRDRLQPLWQAGALLPLAGMSRSNREQMQELRGVLLVKAYLEGADLTEMRRLLAVSQRRWQWFWQGFRQTVHRSERSVEEIAQATGCPPLLVEGWLRLWGSCQKRQLPQEELRSVPGFWWEGEATVSPGDRQERFYRLLLDRHGYSPAAAGQFEAEIREIALQLNRHQRQSGDVLYVRVASDEPPGLSLTESRLLLVNLPYVVGEDWQRVNRDSPQELKWARLERLSTTAYAQGVALTQADLAYLLGISTPAVQDCLKEHPNVLLPTRGRVADMGPTLTHAEKIIRLYMDGYTETEIVRRTGHSYDSVERYLLDFARVTVLLEKGMPISAIRTVLGRSRRVVERYVALYQEFATGDCQWRLGQIRRLGGAHPAKKNYMIKEAHQ